MVNVEDIRNYCDKEGFFIATKDDASIAIKSFTRRTEWLTNWASDVLDLSDILDQRELRPGKSWEDVFQLIEQFVSSRLDYKEKIKDTLQPFCSSLSICIVPLWASTIWRTRISPRPCLKSSLSSVLSM